MEEKGRGGFFAGARRDSVVQFDGKLFDDVQRLAAMIRERTQDLSASAPEVTLNPVDQIRKLAELRDADALTKQEFVERKKELLARL